MPEGSPKGHKHVQPPAPAVCGDAIPVPRWERWSLPGMLVVVVALLVPALTESLPMYHEDNVAYCIPQFMAVARSLQKGEIPLWDPNTFSGGLPHYANDETPIYYLPLMPFLLLADLDNLSQSAYMVYLLPFCLHVVAAALGGYFFGRLVLRLRAPACAAVGLLYGMGPDMPATTFLSQIGFVHAYAPWVMLAVARFMATRRMGWWLGGVVLFSLMLSAGEPNFASRICFLTGATAALAAAFSCRRQPRILLTLLATGGMLVAAIGIVAPLWCGTLDGILWFNQGIGVERAAEKGSFALPPAALVTLFAPGFLGILDGGHGWGVGLVEGMSSWAFLAGGMFTVFAALTPVVCRRFRTPDSVPADDDARNRRLWTWIALAMLAFDLILILGRNTSLFRPLSFVMPWIKIPREIYYRFGMTWFLAILVGLGLSRLLSLRTAEMRARRVWLALGCVLAALLLGLAALLQPVKYEGGAVPAYQTLTKLGEWDWFLQRPVLYLGLASAALIAVAAVPWRRAVGWMVLGGVLAEAIFFGFTFLYEPVFGPRARHDTDLTAPVIKRRYAKVTDHPYFAFAPILAQAMADKDARLAGSCSDIDNLAWVLGSHALLGYDSKPLMPRMREMATRFTYGEPYALYFKASPALFQQFLRNMNVGYVVAYSKEVGRSPFLTTRGDFLSVLRMPNPVPFAYMQNRVAFLPPSRQADILWSDDIRVGVCVEPGPDKQLPEMVDAMSGQENYLRDFFAMQEANPIRRLDRSHANRKVIDVRVTQPAMLVLTECYHPGWSATVDGKTVPLWQVNYLQQGLWLTRGDHVVELRFFPQAVGRGLAISGVSITLIVAVVAAAWLIRRRRNKGAHPQ